MSFIKKHLSTILLSLMLLTGIVLLIYPSFSNWWNSFHQSRAVSSYTERVSHIDDDEYALLIKEVEDYNRELAEKGIRWEMTAQEKAQYENVLNVGGNGIMGYIEIPVINVILPIYHGTEDTVLQTAVGHLEGTSLPIGGPGSHCVLSGHRGLPSARLFTDLDRLTSGDTFILNILDEVLTYEVDQIRIVLPTDLSNLNIEEGKDYCTLVTCTPYGINTHRLLVRGKRIETKNTSSVRVTADAMQVDRVLVAISFGVPMLLLILAVWLTVSGLQRRSKRKYRDLTWRRRE